MKEEVIKLADLALTSHALARMYARRFSEGAVQAALQHGREVHGRGAVIFAIGRKEVMHARTIGHRPHRLRGYSRCLQPRRNDNDHISQS